MEYKSNSSVYESSPQGEASSAKTFTYRRDRPPRPAAKHTIFWKIVLFAQILRKCSPSPVGEGGRRSLTDEVLYGPLVQRGLAAKQSGGLLFKFRIKNSEFGIYFLRRGGACPSHHLLGKSEIQNEELRIQNEEFKVF